MRVYLRVAESLVPLGLFVQHRRTCRISPCPAPAFHVPCRSLAVTLVDIARGFPRRFQYVFSLSASFKSALKAGTESLHSDMTIASGVFTVHLAIVGTCQLRSVHCESIGHTTAVLPSLRQSV